MRNKKKKNKSYLVIVVLIMILMLGLLVYNNRSLLQLGAGKQVKTAFSYETGQQYQFESQKNNILALNNEGVICISQYGGQPWNIFRQLTNPSMHSEDGYTLLYDRGSKDVAAYNNGVLMWEHKTDQPIITAKINPKGYSAIVTYDIGYKGKIEIYNVHGGLVYKWQLGENYVVDVDVSPDCKYFAAVAISPSDINLTSKVSVVDIDAEKVIGETVRSDSLIISIKYQTSGALVALGEDELLGISAKGEQSWVVDFDGRELQKFLIPYDTSCILSFSGSRNNSILEVYNREGQKSGEYISESEIKAIDVSNNTIAVVEKRSLILINLKGKVASKTELQKEIHDVMFLSRGKIAVVSNNSVDIIKP